MASANILSPKEIMEIAKLLADSIQKLPSNVSVADRNAISMTIQELNDISAKAFSEYLQKDRQFGNKN